MEKRIKNFAFPYIDSRMYTICEDNSCLVVDPIELEKIPDDFKENDIEDVVILLTHEHLDHISGVNWFREKYHCTVICQESCSKNMQNARRNLAEFYQVLFMDAPAEVIDELEQKRIDTYTCKEADITFDKSYDFVWEDHKVHCISTPGHSKGSCCIFLDEDTMFSGDTLVNGAEIITRLPGGNKKIYEERTLPFLQTLSPDLMVYPGHGDAQKLGEWAL